jgi:hypothetical protein
MKITKIQILKGLFFGCSKLYCYYLVVDKLFKWNEINLLKKIIGLFLLGFILFYEIIITSDNKYLNKKS